MPKLTLSADPTTVTLAKAVAARHGTSVSAMFERFVALTAAEQRAPGPVGALTRRVSGIVSMRKGASARSLIEDALLERHGMER